MAEILVPTAKFKVSVYETDSVVSEVAAEISRYSTSVHRSREQIDRYSEDQIPIWATTFIAFLSVPAVENILKKMTKMFASPTPPRMLKFNIGPEGSSFICRDVQVLIDATPSIVAIMREQSILSNSTLSSNADPDRIAADDEKDQPQTLTGENIS